MQLLLVTRKRAFSALNFSPLSLLLFHYYSLLFFFTFLFVFLLFFTLPLFPSLLLFLCIGKASLELATDPRVLGNKKMSPAGRPNSLVTVLFCFTGTPPSFKTGPHAAYLSSAKYLMVRTIWLVYEFSLSYHETTFTSVEPSPMGMHLVCVASNSEPYVMPMISEETSSSSV